MASEMEGETRATLYGVLGFFGMIAVIAASIAAYNIATVTHPPEANPNRAQYTITIEPKK